jgi:hypothetical protein
VRLYLTPLGAAISAAASSKTSPGRGGGRQVEEVKCTAGSPGHVLPAELDRSSFGLGMAELYKF